MTHPNRALENIVNANTPQNNTNGSQRKKTVG